MTIFRRNPLGASMSFKEIAAKLDISEGTAYSHYQNAMRKLRSNPEILAEFMELIDELSEARQAREGYKLHEVSR